MPNLDLFYYSELDSSGKAYARASVLSEIIRSYREKFASYVCERQLINLNQRINSGNMAGLYNSLSFLRRYQLCQQQFLEKLIVENLCQFDAGGRYYLFMERRFSDELK
ncbi:hypothetical protein ACI0X9_003366 [Cronobacter turicensis]